MAFLFTLNFIFLHRNLFHKMVHCKVHRLRFPKSPYFPFSKLPIKRYEFYKFQRSSHFFTSLPLVQMGGTMCARRSSSLELSNRHGWGWFLPPMPRMRRRAIWQYRRPHAVAKAPLMTAMAAGQSFGELSHAALRTKLNGSSSESITLAC